MTPTMAACLRALRDCGTIRVRNGHPGYAGLAAGGYAVARRVSMDAGSAVDFRLTDAGRDAAQRLPPLLCGRSF